MDLVATLRFAVFVVVVIAVILYIEMNRPECDDGEDEESTGC